MVADILLITLGCCFLVAGLAGCIVPAIPGPPLSYVALLLLQATSITNFSGKFLLIAAAVTVVVTVIDFVLPAWGTKKWGGSRAGTIGAVFGLLLGLFFPPVGIIVGTFTGAVAGELIAGRNAKSAFRSGFGSLLGFLMGTVMKLAICLTFSYYFVKELIVAAYLYIR